MKSIFDVVAGSDALPLDDSIVMSGEDFAIAIINSREYRQSVIDRIQSGRLPPAVECRLLDAAGLPKAPQRLEHTGANGEAITITEIQRVVVRPDAPVQAQVTH